MTRYLNEIKTATARRNMLMADKTMPIQTARDSVIETISSVARELRLMADLANRHGGSFQIIALHEEADKCDNALAILAEMQQ